MNQKLEVLPFSDANTLYAYIEKNFLNNGTLTISAQKAAGLSTDIQELISQSALFPNAKIEIQNCTLKKPNTAQGPVTCNGNFFGTVFLNQTSGTKIIVVGQPTKSVTLTFYFDGNHKVQLEINARMQSGWTAKESFPQLKGTDFGDTSWGDAGFVFASTDSTTDKQIKKNLNFYSKLPAGKLLFMPVEAFFTGGYDNVYLKGPIELTTGLSKTPAMTLTTDAAQADNKIGSLEVDVVLTATIAQTSATQCDMTISASINIEELGGDINLIGTLDGTSSSIDIIADFSKKPKQMDGLNALNGLSSGPVFGSQVPSSFVFSSPVSLGYISVRLSQELFSTTATLSRIAAGIAYQASPKWPIFAGLIDIENLSIEFAVNDPLGSPSLSATLGTEFDLDGQGPIDISVELPDLIVTGGLPSYPAPAATLDLSALLNQLYDHSPAPAKPKAGDTVIDQLFFSAEPKQHTYTFNGHISTQLRIPGLPKGDLELDGITWKLEQQTTSKNFYFAAQTQLLKIPVTVIAQKDGPSDAPWSFGAYLSQATPFKTIVDDLLPHAWNIDTTKVDSNLASLEITNLGATLTPQYGDYSFIAAFDWPFTIGGDYYDVAAQFQLHKSGGTSSSDQKTTSGLIEGDIAFNGIALAIVYKFAPQATEILFRYNQLTVTYAPDPTNDPTLTIAFGDATLGDLLNYIVELAEHGSKISFPAPWHKLFDIQLNGLSIIIHTKTKEISVRYMHDFNFAFIDFQGFEIEYKKQYGKSQVTMKVFGNFLGTEYGPNNPITWDPMNEGPPPATPGSKFLDISYVGLGQHVALANPPAATVEGVIKQMKKSLLPPTNPSQNPVVAMPDIIFDASSNWMIGTQFIIDNAFQISAVFNDPEVYGLLIEGWGPNAGALQGLKFEILYRKISDDLGQYHIDFLLPTEFRNIQLLEVSIVLPEVIIDIFTNGNFKINAGFPPSIDQLSKSFSVQVFPFAGFGGLYFGYLNGQTSHSVPTITNGKFDPVIEIGLMLSLGLGKTIQVGPMSGGIYVGVTGELQGTFATFYPSDTQSSSARYIDIIGTAGVIGKVYGKVNFVIVQATVSLEVFADITLEIQSHEPIQIDMEAGVRVSVSVKVLFVHIHFHFSTTIHESFTIGHQSKTPWLIAQDSRNTHMSRPNTKARALGATVNSRAALLAEHRNQITHHMVGAGSVGTRPQPAQFNHKQAHRAAGPGCILQALKAEHPSNLAARGKSTHHLPSRFARTTSYTALSMAPRDVMSSTQTVLNLWITPAITQAEKGDIELDNSVAPVTTAAMIPLLLMETSADSSANTVRALVRGTDTPAAFDILAEAVLKWAISDVTSSKSISILELLDLKHLLADTNQVSSAFSFEKLSAFFKASQFTFNIIDNPATSANPKSATLFPVPPAVNWSCNNKLVADFSTYQCVDTKYAIAIDEFLSLLFADYANQVEKETTSAPPIQTSTPKPVSFASYMFSNYFVAILKQLVEQAIQHLSNYKYVLPAGKAAKFNLTDIADQFPSQAIVYKSVLGDTLISIAEIAGVTPEEIVAENPNVQFSPLAPNTNIQISLGVTPESIVVGNWGTDNLIASDVTLPLAGLTHALSNTDSLDSVASLYKDQAGSVTATTIADASCTLNNIFLSGTTLKLGAINYTTSSNDTVQVLATRFGVENAATVPLSTGITLVCPASLDYKEIKTDSTVNATLAKIAIAENISSNLPSFYQQMLDGNPNLAVVASASCQFDSVSLPVIGTRFDLPLVVETATTIEDIIPVWYPSITAPQARKNLQERIEMANSRVDFNQPIPVGTVLTLPMDYSFESIALAFQMGWTATNPSGSLGSVLKDSVGIYSPIAILNIPAFNPQAGANATFKSIAQNYNITATELSGLIDGVLGLFVDQAELHIPHVPALDINTLLQDLYTLGAYTNAGHMATRFFLHGLRLPNPNDKKWQHYMNLPSSAEKISQASTIATYPLYALLGQMVVAPTTASVSVSFAPPSSGAVDWLKFNGTQQAYTTALLPEALAQIKSFKTTIFDPQLRWFEADLGYGYVPQRYPLRHKFHWQSPSYPVALNNPNQTTSDVTIWPIPDTLASIITEANSPMQMAIESAARSTTGSTKVSALSPTMWATLFEVTIQQMPTVAGEKASPNNSYLLSGTDHEGMMRVLSLLEYANRTGNSLALHILYPPNTTETNAQGYMSSEIDRSKTQVLKTNLSTRPVLGSTSTTSPTTNTYVADVTSSKTFLEFIYQASIVKSGGFYLSYFDSTGAGLPSTIFSGGDTAKITILAINPTDVENEIQPFNNVALVNENLDNNISHVFASIPFKQIGHSDTLETVASALHAYVATAESLVKANADITGILVAGLSLSYQGGASYIILPSDTISSLMTKLKVPDTATFATTYGNQIGMLKPGAFIGTQAGQLRPKATMKPGNIGFSVARTEPKVDASVKSPTDSALLNSLYNLFGYQTANMGGYIKSLYGLPVGPTDNEAVTPDSSMPTENDDGLWIYHQTINVAPFADPTTNTTPLSKALPRPDANPYLGINSKNSVTINGIFHDIFGNTAGSAAALKQLSIATRYMDNLIGPDAWPGISKSYAINKTSTGPVLQLHMTGSASQYVANKNTSFDAALKSAQADRVHAATIWYQLQDTQADISVAELGSVAATSDQCSVADVAIQLLLDSALQNYLFLDAVTTTKQPHIKGNGSNGLATMAASYGLSASDMLIANPDMTLSAIFDNTNSFKLPVYQSCASNETANNIIANGSIDLKTLAANNPAAKLTEGVAIQRPALIVSKNDIKEMSLSEIAATYGTPIQDTIQPVSKKVIVPGFAELNKTVPITEGTTFTYHYSFITVASGPVAFTYTSQSGDGLKDVAETIQASIRGSQGQASTKAHPCDPNAVVTATDIALANSSIQSIFDGSTDVTVRALIIPSDATLLELAESCWIGPDPAAEMLNDNGDVQNLFFSGIALLVGVKPHQLELSDTASTLATQLRLQISDIGTVNGNLAVQSTATLKVPYQHSSPTAYALYRPKTNDQLSTIKALGISFADLADLNANVRGLFTPGSTLKANNKTHISKMSDTPASIASSLGYSGATAVERLFSDCAAATVLREASTWIINKMFAEETFSDTVKRYWPGFSSENDITRSVCWLAQANASLAGLLSKGNSINYPGLSTSLTLNGGETLTSVAETINSKLGKKMASPAAIVLANPSLKLNSVVLISAPAQARATLALTPKPTASHFPLKVSISIQRDHNAVAEVFTGSEVESVTTVMTPDSENAPGSEADNLKTFAANIEAAIPGFKVATGPKQASTKAHKYMAKFVEPVDKNHSLWIANFSETLPNAYSFKADLAKSAQYAIAPLATKLWHWQDLSMSTYVSGKGMIGSKQINIVDGRPDKWANELFELIDTALSPQYALAAQQADSSTLLDLISTKGKLAASFSKRLTPILKGQNSAHADDAQNALYQDLLVELGQAYSVESILQLPFTGNGDPGNNAALFTQPKANVLKVPANNSIAGLSTSTLLSKMYLVEVLIDQPYLIQPGVLLTFKGVTYTSRSNDTLRCLLRRFKNQSPTLADLYNGNIAPMTFLKKDGNTGTSRLSTQTTVNSSLTTLAAAYDLMPTEFLSANADIALFAANEAVDLGADQSYTPTSDATPTEVASHLGNMSIDQLGAALWRIDIAAAAKQHNPVGSYKLKPGVTLYLLHLMPQMNLSSANVPLINQATSANYKFTVKNAAQQKSIYLDLGLDAVAMQVDIESNSSVQGYETSEWLHFVRPISNNSSGTFSQSADIGQTNLLVPLREIPSLGNLGNQQVKVAPQSTSISQLADWTYSVDLKRKIAAQDQLTFKLHVDVNSTVISTRNSMQDTPPALFVSLAEFHYSAQQIAADLSAFADPAATKAMLSHATSAIDALNSVAKKFETALTAMTPSMDAHLAKSAAGSTKEITYSYEITPVANEADPDELNYLLITMPTPISRFAFYIESSDLSGPSDNLNKGKLPNDWVKTFLENGFTLAIQPTITTLAPGSDWEIVDNENLQTYVVTITNTPINAFIIKQKYFWPSVTVPHTLLDTNHTKGLAEGKAHAGLLTATQAASLQIKQRIQDHSWQLHEPETGKRWLLFRETGPDGQLQHSLHKVLNAGISGNKAYQLGNSLLLPLQTGGADTAPKIGNLVDLRFDFENLMVLSEQNASSSCSVTRNNNLLAGSSTAAAFVYQSDPAKVPNPLSATVVHTDLVDITNYGKSVDTALQIFFEQVLFQALQVLDNTAKRYVTINGHYLANLITDQTGPLLQVPFPLTMSSSFNYAVDGSATFASDFGKAIKTYADSVGTPMDTGGFMLEVQISTDIGGLPGDLLLQLNRVYYSLGKSTSRALED